MFSLCTLSANRWANIRILHSFSPAISLFIIGVVFNAFDYLFVLRILLYLHLQFLVSINKMCANSKRQTEENAETELYSVRDRIRFHSVRHSMCIIFNATKFIRSTIFRIYYYWRVGCSCCWNSIDLLCGWLWLFAHTAINTDQKPKISNLPTNNRWNCSLCGHVR